MRSLFAHRRQSAACFTAALVLLAACGGGSEGGSGDSSGGGSSESEGSAPATFTTGDLEALGLAEDDVEGLEYTAGRSGPVTLRQGAAGDQALIERLESSGYVLGAVQRFDAPGIAKGTPKPNDMGAVVMGSRASIYEAEDGATQSSTSAEPPSSAMDYEKESVEELGEQGQVARYLQSTSWGSAPTVSYSWTKLNAAFSLTAIGLSRDLPIDEAALLAMATTMYESAEPSGEPALALPKLPADLEVVLEDDFSDPDSGWAPQDFGAEAFSQNRDGAWFMHVDSLNLWNGSDEIGREELTTMSDVRVEFTARPAEENEVARYGGVCRASTEANQAYGAWVGTDGSVGITRSADAAEVLVQSADGAKGVLSPDGDQFRMECTGDDLVHIALYVNDELVIDALDDDPYPPAGAGMYVEAASSTPPIPSADVLFDDMVISAGS